MKKILTSLTVVLVFVMMSCGGGNTPGKVVEGAFMKIGEGDFAGAADMMAKEDGALTAEEHDKVVALLSLAKGQLEENEGIKAIEVLSEEIAEDGNSADIKYKIIYGNGEEEEDEAKVVLLDGEWKLLFDN